MRYLRVLVISLVIIMLSTRPAHALVCNRYKDDQGFVENTYVIDGVVYRTFTLEEANRIAKDLQELNLLRDKVKLLEDSNKLKDSHIKEQAFHINFLEKRVNFNPPQTNPSRSLIGNPNVSFIAGVGVCSLSYGFWSYANKRSSNE